MIIITLFDYFVYKFDKNTTSTKSKGHCLTMTFALNDLPETSNRITGRCETVFSIITFEV